MIAKNPGRIPTQLPPLPPKTNKKKIKASKYKDLLNLLQFVPPVHHRFYRSLDYQGNTLTRQAQSREDQPCEENPHHEEDNIELENFFDILEHHDGDGDEEEDEVENGIEAEGYSNSMLFTAGNQTVVQKTRSNRAAGREICFEAGTLLS
ncbi:hypothetical protein J6590_091641 [Homalodisca vitripennis]|nr:hypothetical protein J6590_091641 [Homalodisca vitripennis]